MNINRLFVPLGVDSTPIGQRKQIAPLVAAAAIAGGASMLGGIINSASAASANDKNLQATRETNQMNYQIAQEANRLSNEQFYSNQNWLKTQYYDTDQYARLRESLAKGGLNPALAYGSANPVGSVGQASPTSFHTAQMEAGHVDPVRYGDALSESVGSATNAYFQNQLLNAQAENVGEDTQTRRINNITQAQRNLLELNSLFEEIQKKKSDKSLSDSQKAYYDKLEAEVSRRLDLLNDQYDDLKVREKYTNDVLIGQKDNLIADSALKRAQTAFQNVMTALYPSLTQSQIAVNMAQFNDLVRSAELKVKQGELTDAQSVSQYLKNGVDALDFIKENKRHQVHNSNKATRVFYGTLDEIGHTLFSNLRLFGK